MPRLRTIAKMTIAEIERVLAEKKAQAAAFLRKERDRIDAELARLEGQQAVAPKAKRGRPAKAAPKVGRPAGRTPGRKAGGRAVKGATAKVIAALKSATKPLSVGEIKTAVGLPPKYNAAATLARLAKEKKIERHGSPGAYTYSAAK